MGTCNWAESTYSASVFYFRLWGTKHNTFSLPFPLKFLGNQTENFSTQKPIKKKIEKKLELTYKLQRPPHKHLEQNLQKIKKQKQIN